MFSVKDNTQRCSLFFLLDYEENENCDGDRKTYCAKSEDDLGGSIEGHCSCSALSLNDVKALKRSYYGLVDEHHDGTVHKSLRKVEGQKKGWKHFHNHRCGNGKTEVKRGDENVKKKHYTNGCGDCGIETDDRAVKVTLFSVDNGCDNCKYGR